MLIILQKISISVRDVAHLSYACIFGTKAFNWCSTASTHYTVYIVCVCVCVCVGDTCNA